MLLGGLQKTTLIDFPGKIACTVFMVGCNFRCPFCHNRDLVTLELFKRLGIKPLTEIDFFDFLKKRKSILDGVCITGGEPTIQKDLPDFIKKIKALGYLVKLDTNGSNPEITEKLIKDKLVDYIAVDIKGDIDNYKKFTRIKVSKFSILRSIEKIVHSGIPFEFRTTIVPGLHNKNNMVKLAKDLKRTIEQFNHLTIQPFRWFLQPFRPQNCLDPKFLTIKPFTDPELKEILKLVQTIIPQTKMRGNL